MRLYSMKEACEQVGFPYETLKFYCNEGLVPGMQRDEHNHRVFDEKTVRWISSLQCLRNCRMSIAEMKAYLDLCLQGPTTIEVRKEVLAQKREELCEELAQLQEAIDYIDSKQTYYDDVLAGRVEYKSNLVAQFSDE